MPTKKTDDKLKNNISKINPVKIAKVVNDNDEEKNLHAYIRSKNWWCGKYDLSNF